MRYSIGVIKECIKTIRQFDIYELDIKRFMSNQKHRLALSILLKCNGVNRNKIWGVDVSMRSKGKDAHPYHDREDLYYRTNEELFLIFQQSYYLDYQERAQQIGADYDSGNLYLIVKKSFCPKWTDSKSRIMRLKEFNTILETGK